MLCSHAVRTTVLIAACSSVLLLTGCSSSADMDKLRADIARAQQTADAANRKADQALSVANQANQTANDANQRLDRVFKKSMMK